ncbi:hypothetical protein BC941DRAFT_427545 [Chlamydoabsidia padenii]|nr:hypothetical protein BC941DRAFT_427545 [Chlamydoabsidia padenii]
MTTVRWAPLSKIAHGIAIAPFTPTNPPLYSSATSSHSRPITVYSNIQSPTTDSSLLNANRLSTASSDISSISTNDYAYLAPLEVGDELYIFEQNGAWYRGYVLSSLEEGRKPHMAPNGIFPRSHVQIKEYVDMDLADCGILLSKKYSSATTTIPMANECNSDNGGLGGFDLLPLSPTPSSYSGSNVVFNSTFTTDSMSRSPSGSQFGNHELVSPPPLLSPTLNLSTTTTSTSSGLGAGHSRPTSGIDFDNNSNNNISSSPADIQPQYQRPFQSRSTADGDHDHQQQQQLKRPSPPPLPMVRFDQSTVTGMDEPLVDEIAACVSEWNCLLYTYLQESRYAAFNAVRDHINYLFQARRQLLDQALSREELSRLRKEIIQRMVTMNISQYREMIIRHPERGFILDINSTSVATLYYMHWKYTISEQVPITSLFPQSFLSDTDSVKTSNGSVIPTTSSSTSSSSQQRLHGGHSSSPSMSSLNDQQHRPQQQRHQTKKRKVPHHYKGGEFHHMFFDLKACVAHICQPGEWTELKFSLYSASQGKFVAEQFVVHLNYNGMPKDERQIGKLQSLFVDLASQDLNEHLYLVCHIFRLGGMKSVDKEKDHLGSLGSHASSLFGGHHNQQQYQHGATGNGGGHSSSFFGSNHNQQQYQHGATGNGSGYFDYNKRNHQRNNSQQQNSVNSNDPTAIPLSAHTNLFRRPFGCAVLNIGRLLQQVDHGSAATQAMYSNSTGNGGTPTGPRSATMYSDVDLMRSPTLSAGSQLSPTATQGSSNANGNTINVLSATSATTSSSGPSSNGDSGNHAVHYFIAPSEHDMRIYTPSSESTFAHLHEDIIQDNTKELDNNPRAEMICVYLRMFYGQQDEVLKINAALLQGIPLTPRIGFPDVVFPDDERNELYITLNSGDFAQFGRTRNIQVILCARDNITGDVVEMAVSVGSGTSKMSTWESAIYYHEMKPTWNEMVKIKISDVSVWQRSHVFLVVKHRSRHGGGPGSINGNNNGYGNTPGGNALARMTVEGNTSSSDKILAMGYIPLFIPPLSNDFVADGTHTLCLYKYDRQLLHPSSYFGVLPWCSQTTAPSNLQGQESMIQSVLRSNRQRTVGHHHSNSSYSSVKSGSGSSGSLKNLPLFHQNGSHHTITSVGMDTGSSSHGGFGGASKLHAVRDSLVVSTFLCSTRFTQNTTLVQLINWRAIVEGRVIGKSASATTATSNGVDDLLVLLDKFTFVGEQEVVKFLADIFDALLDILAYRLPDAPEKQDALHDQVIVAITWVLSIVQDRRFSNFRPVLNVYINQRFYSFEDDDDDDDEKKTNNSVDCMDDMTGGKPGSPDVNPRRKVTLDETTYNQLLKGLIRLATNPSDITKAKRLRSSIKVWEYLFRFIERSREMQRSNEDQGEHELRELMYKEDLQQFFDLATNMMRPDQPNSMIGTQTLVLQHFCEAITEVRDAYSSSEIVDIISTFVDACSHVTGKLVGFKLSMILAIIKAPIFSDKACCCELGNQVVRWIQVWLNSYMAVAKEVIFARTADNGNGSSQHGGGDDHHQQTRLPRAQWIENLRLSLTIVHEILDKIRKVRGMSIPGLSSATAVSASSVHGGASSTTGSVVAANSRTRPVSMSTAGDEEEDYEPIDNGDSPLNSLTSTLMLLVPQLLHTYKDLQRLTNQAIQATAAPSSGRTNNSAPTSMTMRDSHNSMVIGSNATRPNSRHSLTVLRERANSIRGLPSVLENMGSSGIDQYNGAQFKPVPSPVVLQALATSPTTPFPSIYPFQSSTSSDVALMAGSDLAAMVTSGLMDLTVVLLDLFHLTPGTQWIHLLRNMATSTDGTPTTGPKATADYISTLCYVCMAMLYGDDIQKLAETHGTVDGYDAFMEDPTRERRKWAKDWLNLDVVAHKIILANVLTPITALLDIDLFAPSKQQQDAEGDDVMVKLWRTVFVTVVRILASSSLEVETLLPQAQRAVWKLAGNIRGEEGVSALELLWDSVGPSRRQSTIKRKNDRLRQESKDLKMKPQLLAFFDQKKRHSAVTRDDIDTGGDPDDSDLDSLSDLSSNDGGDGDCGVIDNGNRGYGTTSSLDKKPSSEDTTHIHLDLVPILLKPLCAASLTLHDKLRVTTIGMMADLFAIQTPTSNDAATLQNMMIGTIDKLVMTYGKGSDEIRVKWVVELEQALQVRLTTDQEHAWGQGLVDSLANLMELLLKIRSLPMGSAEFMDERINATLQLMKFIQVCERQEIYVKYVHQLVDLHLQNNNFVEAALTLRFHADLLSWDPYDEVDAIPELGFGVETQFTRKQALYETMITYLDKGTAWELCVDLCQELADHYATTLVDYERCSGILHQKATFMENIVKKERYYSEYFRVGFYGRGFPAGLRNQHFIYRGMAWEKMSSFMERMQNRHPNVQLVSGKMASSPLLPEDQIRELEAELDGQYIQITALTPVMDPQASPILMNPLASDKVKKYYHFNNVSHFTYSRPVTREDDNYGGNTIGDGILDDITSDSNDNSTDISSDDTSILTEAPIMSKQELDFLHLWTERTTFTSEDTFPGIALRSKIVSIEIREISPIENAVEAMNNKTKELTALEKTYSVYLSNKQASFNLNPFSMSLNGAVDAPVNGGVPLYKKAFLSPYYVKKHPGMRNWVDQLKKAIDEQVIVIDRCLDTHDKLVSTEMRPFHSNLVELYKKNFVDDISQLKRRGTALKSATLPTTITTKDKGFAPNSNKGIKPPPSRLNLASSTSSSVFTAGIQHNRRGSSLFRDMDRPLTMKSRTNSVTSYSNGATTPGGTGHFSSLMSPKSVSYFSIPTLKEEQQQKSRSSDRLQSVTNLTTSQTDNRNITDSNQHHRNHQNNSVATSPVSASLIHPNDPTPSTKSDGGGLSKSLKMSILKATRKATSSSGANQK